MPLDNLYKNLHRSSSGWDEDFLTEALTHLLKYLQEYEPDAAYSILNRLTDSLPRTLDAKISEISISTQLSTDFGVPDICITHPSFMTLIEVKVDADFGSGQLEGYRQFLSEIDIPNVRLNTLTRYGQAGDRSEVDLAIRWNQVADWLDKLSLKNQVARYLRNEFVEFLKQRGVAMDKVEWDLVPGIKSLLSLLNMIEEAMAAAQITNDRNSFGKSWQGYYKKYDGNKRIFIGIYFDNPAQIRVQTENSFLDDGLEITQGKIVNGQWIEILDLASEEIYFFARSKQSQLSCLEKFLSESVSYADRLLK